MSASVYLEVRLLRAAPRSTWRRVRSAAEVAEAASNWFEHYQIHQAEYEPGPLETLGRRRRHAIQPHGRAAGDVQIRPLGAEDPRAGERKDLEGGRRFGPADDHGGTVHLSRGSAAGNRVRCESNGWTDRSISLGLFLLYSIPAFVAGMLFLVFFCYGEYSDVSDGADCTRRGPRSFVDGSILPTTVACRAAGHLPVIVQPGGVAMYARSGMLDVINQDYIRTARAKGLAGTRLILKHALRNGMIPILTLFSSFLPAMLGGACSSRYYSTSPGWDTGFQFDRTERFPDADGLDLHRRDCDAAQHPDHGLALRAR